MNAIAMLGLFLKVTLILGAGSLALAVARRQSAALRHGLMAATLAGALLTPVLTPVLGGVAPSWRLPIVPARIFVVPQTTPPNSGAIAPVAPRSATTTKPVATWDRGDAIALIAGIVWLGGIIAVLGSLVSGVAVMRRTLRSARAAGSRWQHVASELAPRLGVTRRVVILIHDTLSIPITAGVGNCVIVLPADAERWTEQRGRAVLAHELAHVRRYDCLIEYLAWITCAVYWWHPLAWRAAARLRVERERSCDDMVLALGTPAVDYAEHLVELAAVARDTRWHTGAALAMAPVGPLEARVHDILDEGKNRRRVTRGGRLGIACAAAIVTLPLAAFQPGGGRETVEMEVPIAPNDSVSWHGPLSAGATLSVRASMGDITIDSSTSGDVEVVARRRAGPRGQTADTRIVVTRAEGRLIVCAMYIDGKRRTSPCSTDGDWGRVSIDDNDVGFSVRVPSGVHLRVQSGMGLVRASGIHGDVFVLNGNGDARIESDGAADITSYTGRVAFTRLPGGSGGPVSLRVLHGGISAQLPTGAEFDAAADTGLVRITGPSVSVAERNTRYVGTLLGGRWPVVARIQKGDVDIAIK